MNPDGTGQSQLQIGLDAAWSPDGSRIAFAGPGAVNSLVIYTMKADGSDVRQVTPGASYDFAIVDNSPAWSPDGQKIAFDRNVRYPDSSAWEIDTMNPNGTGRVTVTQGADPNWSPDGQKLAFEATLSSSGPFDLYVANAGGTGRTNLTNSAGANENAPAWSPDGTKIAFVTNKDGNYEVYSMNGDGTGATNLTQNSANDNAPDWQPISPTAPNHPTATSVSCSPSTVAPGQSTTCTATVSDTAPSGQTAPAGVASFTSDGAGSFSASSCTLSPSGASSSCQVTYTPSAVGSFTHKITASYGGDPTHDPSSGDTGVIVSTAYPRPRGATPFKTYFVPAYKQCTAVNRTHGSPLAFPSCNPPQQASSHLTVGSPDANGAGARSIGFIKLRVRATSPEDVLISGSISDVRCLAGTATSVCSGVDSADGPDYSGELQATAMIRITDHYNGPGLNEAATVRDIPFPINLTCSNTADTAIGGSCNVNTSTPVVCPECGVKEGQRTIVQLDQIQVFDGGSDGQVSTTADNTLFMVQGVFVP
jgi:hypothetical protein